MKVKYLLSDLDGVIRKFPSQRDKEIEEKFNLPLGSLFDTAFEKTILHKAVCGTITDESWRIEITKNISKICDDQTANQAVNEWSDFPGDVDYKYLDCAPATLTSPP